MQWLRLYTEICRDRKLRRLLPAHRWLWIAVMTIAKMSPQPGWLLLTEGLPVTIGDLADEAAISEEETRAGIAAFIDLKMLEEVNGVLHCINWDKRQFTSDNSTERSRRYRECKKETLQKRCNDVAGTPPDTDTDTDNKDHDHRHACNSKIYATLEQEFGRTVSPMELQTLEAYLDDGLPVELITEAIKRTRLQGKTTVKYAASILNSWRHEGITNLAGVERLDRDFEQRKKGQPKSREPTFSADKKAEIARSLY